MIIGIGTDIVEISRIDKALSSQNSFLKKVYTDVEIEYMKSRNMNPQHAAGMFAAKEAAAKALGTGFRNFGLKDIEIYRDALGKPEINLKKNARKLAESYGNYKIHLSISHCKDNAIAYVILEVLT
ncbi:holo-ACP synthase [Clostridium oryzae]|uniref:Holo-[acyl-carrier-protein] synthase n=1 Tax=Clostridium oryzae TaxID=1450648 RepID=A0A1V4IYF2_9CLOT|nr:holo-ACP synthase [Clostridium oryzae]OPJ65098.1 holo-[acyl-carrier-protein] synthase [Clostridium oryzae]